MIYRKLFFEFDHFILKSTNPVKTRLEPRRGLIVTYPGPHRDLLRTRQGLAQDPARIQPDFNGTHPDLLGLDRV
jgi:hypothetical protein